MPVQRPDEIAGVEEAQGRDVFLVPAERNGLHLFCRALSARRTALLHHASREKVDLNELLRDVIRSRCAAPIAHYINRLNDLSENQRRAAAHLDSPRKACRHRAMPQLAVRLKPQGEKRCH